MPTNDTLPGGVWKNRLLRMQEHQRKYAGQWDRYERLLFGDTKKGSNRKANQLGYAWGLIEGLMTNVYVQNPDALVTSRGPGFVDMARNLTDICRWDLRDMGVKNTGNLLLLDIFCCGYGGVIEVMESAKGTARWRDPETKKPEDVVTVDRQEFKIRRIHPRDLLFDPHGMQHDLSDHRYLAIATYPTVAALKNDPRYSLPKGLESWDRLPEAAEAMRGQGVNVGWGKLSSPDQPFVPVPGLSEERDPEYRTVCVWEIHDRVGRKIVYLTSAGDQIGEIPWPVELELRGRDFFPITIMAMHPHPGRFYPIPTIELIAAQLEELARVDRSWSETATTVLQKVATIGSILTSEARGQLMDPSKPNALVELDGTELSNLVGGAQNMAGLDINKLIGQLPDPLLKRDIPERYMVLQQQIEHQLGYGPSNRGGLPSTRSAREAMMIAQRQTERFDLRFSAIEDFYRDLLFKHVRFLQQKQAITRWARSMPTMGDPGEWFKYDREDLADGEFEFDVIPGSSAPRNTETKKAQELQFAQMVIPILLQTGRDPTPILLRLCRLQGIEHPEEIFNDHEAALNQLGQTLVAFRTGQAGPEDVLTAAAGAVQTGLAPPKLQALAQALQAGMQAQAGAEGMQQAMGAGAGPTMGLGALSGIGMPTKGPVGTRGDPNALANAAGATPPMGTGGMA